MVMHERLSLAWDDRAVVRCVLTAAGPLWFAVDIVGGICDYKSTGSVLRTRMPPGTRLARLADLDRNPGSASRTYLLTTEQASFLAETGAPKLRSLYAFVSDVNRLSVVLSLEARTPWNGSRSGRFAEPGEEGSVTLPELCRRCVDGGVAVPRGSLYSPMPMTPKPRRETPPPTPVPRMKGVPYACAAGVPCAYLPVCRMDGEEPAPFEYESATGATFLYEPVAGAPADLGWDVTPVVVRTDSKFHVFVPRRVDG